MTRVIGRAIVLGVAMAAAAVAQAAAGSLTFVKGHNVWLANPDGRGSTR